MTIKNKRGSIAVNTESIAVNTESIAVNTEAIFKNLLLISVFEG